MKKLGILRQGRLGNQMFEIAAAKKIAKDYNYEFVGLIYSYSQPRFHFDNSGDYINNSILRKCPIINMQELRGNWIMYPNRFNRYLDEPILPIQNYQTNILLNDFYQDVRYIDKDIANELFSPYESIKIEIKNLYGDLSEYTSVQVRRGDYLKEVSNYFHKEDIQNAIDIYFPNDKIIFVSDDIAWCKENFKGNKFIFADKPCKNGIEMDLYLQTQCKNNLISNSTFGWWGAYLNPNPNKKVVCPYPWFENMKNGFKQIIPEDWIKYERLQ